MPADNQTLPKTFYLPKKLCRWLERKRQTTGVSQTRIVIDALEAAAQDKENHSYERRAKVA